MNAASGLCLRLQPRLRRPLTADEFDTLLARVGADFAAGVAVGRYEGRVVLDDLAECTWIAC
jgi:hypothetical protein